MRNFLKTKGSVFHVACVKNETFDNLLRVRNLNEIKKNILPK